MERIVNFRPLFFCFLAFAVGIGFAHYIFSLDYVIIAVAGLVFISLLIFSIYRKQLKKFLIIVIAFIIGLSAFGIDSNLFAKNNYNGKYCAVYGRVAENANIKDNFAYLQLNDVYINGVKEKNILVSVWFYNETAEFKTGDILTFNANIYNELLFENGEFNSYSYKNKTPYYCSVDIEDITISNGFMNIGEKVRAYIKTLLFSVLPDDTASLSYSVLFGNKAELEPDIKEDFATSGIAHLLAVSGLHISFVVAVLYWVLKKLKCVGVPRFIIVAVFLFAYCYLCNFTASIVRATIMALAFLFIKLLGKQYDLISSIGLAGIIVLLINPLSVFDAGFLMSFLSVLAIGFLYKSFSRFFVKCKLPEKLADTIAIDITTTIAIVPILANYFGQISLLSWLANLICVPLFAFAYMFLFIVVIIISAFNFLGFLLFVPEFIFNIIIWFSSTIASIEFLIIPLYTLDIVLAIIFYLMLFFAGRFFMAKWSSKCIAVSLSIIMGLSVWIVFDRPLTPNTNTYTQLNAYTPSAVLTSKDGEVLVIGNGNLTYTEQYLRYKNINKVHTILLTQQEDDNLVDFSKKYKIQNKVLETPLGIQEIGSFSFQYYYFNNILKAIFVELDKIGVLVAVDNIGTSQAEDLKSKLPIDKIDVLYQNRVSTNFLNLTTYSKVFSREKYSYDYGYYSTLILGSFTFEIQDGIMGKIGREN